VASGTPHTIWDVAVALAGCTGIEPQLVGGHRLGDVRHVVASPRRAQELLGFEAAVPFDAGMQAVAAVAR
jgi:dTDP-L-rhamnose 4-epimerase